MNRGVVIVPTCVPNSLDDIARAYTRYAWTDMLHLDIADGVFAPNTTWMPNTGDMLSSGNSCTLGAHLMVAKPRGLGVSLALLGVRTLIGHVEVFGDADEARRVFGTWKAAGATSLVLGVLMDTPIETLESYLGLCDFVHLMTIATVGRQGIPYDQTSLGRVAEVHAKYPELIISVDGGISEENIAELRRAGASHFAVGSFLAKAKSPEEAYKRLKELADSASR